MDAKTWMTLGFTFFMGCFSGFYLYVTVFGPQYTDTGYEDPSEVVLRIQGQEYGGCMMGGQCPHFELENNRSYTYIMPAASFGEGATDTVVEGKMDRDAFRALTDTLVTTDFESITQKRNRTCDSFTDGSDFVYSIILQGEQYELDTCGTAFYNSELERALRPLWQTFATSSRDLPYILERGMTGSLQDAIDNIFQYDEKRDARARGEIE